MKVKKVLMNLLTSMICLNFVIVPMASSLDSYEYDFKTKQEILHANSTEDEQTIEKNICNDPNSFIEVHLEEKMPLKQKHGWFEENGYRYYRMKSGKLCTKKFIKIDKYYYSFDRKGRMQVGNVKISNATKAFFNKKNGHYKYSWIYLTVVQKNKYNIVCEAQDNRSFVINLKTQKIIDKAGKKLKSRAIKEGSKIKVLYKGNLFETMPIQFETILKIKKI